MTRSVDEGDDVLQSACPRGHGGVAIVWQEWIDPYTRKLKEGNERVLPLLIEIPHSVPICLINCYLPAGEKKTAVNEYSDCISIISELTEKYISTHNIFIAGDLNADLLHRKGKKELLVAELIQQYDLHNLNHRLSQYPTYEHQSGHTSSHLDYFITDKKIPWCDTQILSRDTEIGSINSSTHNPICTHALSICRSKDYMKKPKPSQSSRKTDWESINLRIYREVMSDELAKTDFEIMSSDSGLNVLASILTTAATAAGTRQPTGKPRKSKSRTVWSPAIASAAAEAKRAFWLWKENGRPPHPHALSVTRKTKAKKLRSAQRRESAARRTGLLKRVMQASEDDTRTFHQLIKKNRNQTLGSTALIFSEEELLFDEDDQRRQWANYFEHLSTPEGHIEDSETANLLNLIRSYNTQYKEDITVSVDEVHKAVKSLNKKKSPDIDHITAEHLQLAPRECIHALTLIINKIFQEGKIPSPCKSGFKIPIAKKGKDSKYPTNYRGITITALMGKVVEHLIQALIHDILQSSTSDLQFGFTPGLSPTMATLVLYEALATAKANKTTILAGALDAQKAFDVVRHDILKNKLHTSGVQGTCWNLIDDLYSNIRENVRWKNDYSHVFPVKQGVRQGAVLSTTLYKLYINGLLQTLERAAVGMRIGNIFVGVPTCADDQLLLSDTDHDMRAMITACHQYATEHHYKIHPVKSTVTPLLHTENLKIEPYSLGKDVLPISTTFTHLGLEWSSGSITPDVGKKVQVARKTAYALIGVGLHGENGLSPVTSVKIIGTYILPRLLYGLDAVVLNRKQIEELNAFHKNLLRTVQGLPKSTASESIYLLSGTLPIQAELDIRTLSLFGAICRSDNSTIRQLATRQLGINNRHSWFNHIQGLCSRYDIPLEGSIAAPWKKESWKEYTKISVRNHWTQVLLQGMADKTSLKNLEVGFSDNKILQHPAWVSCSRNPRLVPAATVRVKLLTGTYMTMSRRSKLSQGREPPTCQLCSKEEETTAHFLLRCPALKREREPKLQYLHELGLAPEDLTVPKLLNGPYGGSYGVSQCQKKQWTRLQQAISNFCNSLHNARHNKLNRCTSGSNSNANSLIS